MDVALDRASTGGGAYVSLIGRRVSNGNDYRLKLRYMAGGSVVGTSPAPSGDGDHLATPMCAGPARRAGRSAASPAGDQRHVVDREGVARASPEPSPWLLTATDSTASIQSPGGVGVLIYVSSSWTGTAPALTMDNLRVAPLL